MAEFGVNATQLSQAQGAGSGPVAAVQIPVTGDAGISSAVSNLGNAFNLFVKDRDAQRKAEADAIKQRVVGEYVKKQEAINQGVRFGTINPVEAKMRSRSLFGSYAAGNSEFIADFEAAAKALRGNTELGDVEEKVKVDQAFEQSAKLAAQAAGYTFVQGMTPEQEASQIAAHQAAIRSDADFGRLSRKHAEERAAGTYTQSVQDREAKEFSFKLINEIADTNFTASYDVVRSLATAMKAGSVSPEDAQLQWDQKMKTISAQIQSVAGLNPELAAPYRTLFAELQATGLKLLDPTKASAEAEDQVKLLIARAKLVALAEPGVKEIVATSQLMGQNAQLALSASPAVSRLISKLTSTSVDSGKPVETVVGNPEVEREALGFLRKSLEDFNKGTFKDPKAAVEAKNAIDQTLQQIGDALGKRGVDAKYLKNVAEFVASPEFGQYASKNPIDAEALSAAVRSFQLMYEPTVIKGINNSIRAAVQTSTGLSPNRAKTGAKVTEGTTVKFDPTKIKAVFNGSGINFEFTNPSTDPQVARMEREVVISLRQSQAAVNQLLHMGAHMEGTTNYAKFWEKNKSKLLPQFFSPEEAPAPKPGEKAVVPDGELKFKLEKDLKQAASFTEEELKPDTPENIARRNEQDKIAIQKELERKDLTAEMKAILQRELDRLK